MSKREILKLQSQSPERLLNSPYARNSGLNLPMIQPLLSELDKNQVEAIKPLLLEDIGLEIESIALNFLIELSDQEITWRSILTVEKLLKTA
jgi:hypothetical protein